MTTQMHLVLDAEVFAPEFLGRRCLLIAGERIVWMGPEEPVLPDVLGVERHDLEGRRLVPGLIDCHVHLLGGGGEAGFQSRVPSLALSDLTRAGTTTVVGVLGTDDVVRSTAGLLARVRALRVEGLSAYCLTGGYHLPLTTLTGSVRDDIVHMDPILGVGEFAISDHRSSQPTLDELLRIASDAHVAGLLASKAGILHLHVGSGERGLDLVRRARVESELPARTFHPTHVNRCGALFEEALDLARRGTTIDVTAFPPSGDPDELSAADAVERFLDADVPAERITVSSDAGGSLPVFSEGGEVVQMGVARPSALGAALADLLARGIPPERALPPFTSNTARLLRLPAKGRIRTGADADFVVLDEDGHPRDVMVRGCWHVRDGEVRIRGTFEDA